MNYTVYTDGGSRGNPGPAAIGIFITDQTGKITRVGKYLGIQTNNTAEYQAVITAIETLETMGERGPISFFLDSLLVVSQLNGVYKVKDPNIKILWTKTQNKRKEWGSETTFTYVPREKNKEADKIVNETLDAARVINH